MEGESPTLTIKLLERLSFKQISHIALMFPLLLWTTKCQPEYVQNTGQGISVSVMQFLVNSLFYTWIHELLSKVNSFTYAYNVLHITKWSVYLKVSYFSSIKSYTDIDLTCSLFASFEADAFI